MMVVMHVLVLLNFFQRFLHMTVKQLLPVYMSATTGVCESAVLLFPRLLSLYIYCLQVCVAAVTLSSYMHVCCHNLYVFCTAVCVYVCANWLSVFSVLPSLCLFLLYYSLCLLYRLPYVYVCCTTLCLYVCSTAAPLFT